MVKQVETASEARFRQRDSAFRRANVLFLHFAAEGHATRKAQKSEGGIRSDTLIADSGTGVAIIGKIATFVFANALISVGSVLSIPVLQLASHPIENLANFQRT